MSTTLTAEQLRSVVDWLDGIDSHGIYAASMLAELEPFGVDVLALPSHTYAATVASIRARGLGGTLAPDTGVRLVYGYQLARALALQLTGTSPGDAYMGRGSSFRADVDAIRKAAVAAE